MRFATVPSELEFLRGRGFHSSPCAVAFLTDLARGLDCGLLTLGSADHPMEPARARPLLVEAIDAVLLTAPNGH